MVEPRRLNTGRGGLTEERRQGDKERRQGVSDLLEKNFTRIDKTTVGWYPALDRRCSEEASSPQTCIVEDHGVGSRPGLPPRRVVPDPGRHVEDGGRVEDSLTGDDCILTEKEEEVEKEEGNQNRDHTSVSSIFTFLNAP